VEERTMRGKRATTDQIIAVLKEAEAGAEPVAAADGEDM